MKSGLQKNLDRSAIALKAIVIVLLVACLLPGNVSSAGSNAIRSYIVQGQSTAHVLGLIEKHGGLVTSHLDLINGAGAKLPVSAVEKLLAEPGIYAVTPNALVRATGRVKERPFPATDYPDVIGADLVWSDGTLGKNVTVAVVDTGLGWHIGLFKDINGKIQGRIVGWKDYIEGKRLPIDPNGHGTHVAGIIANSQVGSDNEWNGTAPGVSLVGVRVLDKFGAGTYETVIQGIQWVIENKARCNIRVMNLSLVSAAQSPYWADPLNQAVMRAWAEGIVVVVAAGNGGPGAMTIGVPGNNPYVITAGAFTDNYTPEYWDDDYIAPFSAAGPTLDGFVKPDLVAPGAHMVSTMMPWSYLHQNHQANLIAPTYFSMAGTSQAAAVVSGVSALILSRNPDLSPEQVKYRLMATAFPWVDPVTTMAGYSIWQQGAGRLNAPDAVQSQDLTPANAGLDIFADLAGTTHYEGFSYYDQSSGKFRLRGEFDGWDGGYWAWDGGFGTWSGGFGTWSGGFGTWSGGFGTWSGGFGTWSGGFGTWSGGFGTWSGGFGTWSGGFGTWSGGFGTWSGSEPWSGTLYSDPGFIANFLAGVTPNAATSTTSITPWVEEP